MVDDENEYQESNLHAELDNLYRKFKCNACSDQHCTKLSRIVVPFGVTVLCTIVYIWYLDYSYK